MLHNPRCCARKEKTKRIRLSFITGLISCASCQIFFFYSFAGKWSSWTILLDFRNTRTVAHGEMLPFSRQENRTVLWRHLRFYEWFNGNISPPALPPAFQQYLENIPVCTLMLFSFFGWKEKVLKTHLARSLPSLFPSLLFSANVSR